MRGLLPAVTKNGETVRLPNIAKTLFMKKSLASFALRSYDAVRYSPALAKKNNIVVRFFRTGI
ncbi:hypothetical protein fh0823_11280 [Francisella halioticida]|nr:hypothetical protein [Francisella halioticida]BCD90989.1 hypothetical protein fh0823_11280 [Francisella halioticida]